MATIAVNDIIRITANMNIDGVFDLKNVYHFKALSVNAGDDQSFMDAVALDFDVFYTNVNLSLSDRVGYVDIDGINVTANRLLPSVPWPSLTVGNSAVEMLPETVAGCVFWRTTRPKTRASKFIGGYTEASNIGGILAPAAQAELALLGAALISLFFSDGVEMDFGAYNKEFDRFTPASSVVVPVRWRTQRRRRFGVGS